MTSQFQENLVGGTYSAHNHLAVSVASIRHDIRFHGDNFVSRLYGYCEGGCQCSTFSMTRSYRRVIIKYDSDIAYDIPSTYRVIEFGNGKTYRTYPVNFGYHKFLAKVDQTVSYGKLRTTEQVEQYIDTLCKIGGKIVLANIGVKSYISMIKDSLDAHGITVVFPKNHSFHVLDMYLRSSARLVHFGNGNHGMMYAKGCLYATEGVEFITDCDKVVPTDLSEFINKEKL
jgi:hypothetical protein